MLTSSHRAPSSRILTSSNKPKVKHNFKRSYIEFYTAISLISIIILRYFEASKTKYDSEGKCKVLLISGREFEWIGKGQS